MEQGEEHRKVVESALLEMKSRKKLTSEDHVWLHDWAVDLDAEIRLMVVSFLAQRSEKAAGKLMLQCSEDSNSAVRAYALDVLCNFPGEECSRRLRQAMETEPDPEARYCAIRSLADVLMAMGEEIIDARELFQNAFLRERDALCRLGCCYGRYLYEDFSALQEILRRLEAKQEKLRANALLVLQDIADSRNIFMILPKVQACKERERSPQVQEALDEFFCTMKPILRRVKSNVWAMTRWKSYISKDTPDTRRGLRLRFDPKVVPEIRQGCLDFARWIRQQYAFPVRVPIYIKAVARIRAMDGELVYGTCFCPERLEVEPYIRIAAGEASEISQAEKDEMLAAVIHTMAHELTHYFQWINQLELTPLGAERQANRYAREIVAWYMDTRINVKVCCDVCSREKHDKI